VGLWSGRMDRDSSAASNPRVAGCLPVVPLLQTLMVGANTRHSTPLPGATERHPGVYLLCWGWRCSEGAGV
jgi:hypothetical protein